MKNNIYVFLAIGVFALLAFQNCGVGKAQQAESEVVQSSISEYYPYFDVQPEFFHDIQLVSAEKLTNNKWKFGAAVAVAYAENMAQAVDVEVYFYSGTNQLLCPRLQYQVTNASNHISAYSCEIVTKPAQLKIVIKVKLPTETVYEELSPSTFSL